MITPADTIAARFFDTHRKVGQIKDSTELPLRSIAKIMNDNYLFTSITTTSKILNELPLPVSHQHLQSLMTCMQYIFLRRTRTLSTRKVEINKRQVYQNPLQINYSDLLQV